MSEGKGVGAKHPVADELEAVRLAMVPCWCGTIIHLRGNGDHILCDNYTLCSLCKEKLEKKVEELEARKERLESAISKVTIWKTVDLFLEYVESEGAGEDV